MAVNTNSTIRYRQLRRKMKWVDCLFDYLISRIKLQENTAETIFFKGL